MEPIFKEDNTVPATEILYFPEAEIEKVKGNARSFVSIGSLSCLYFKDYNRFVLQLNDWRYTLLRRLPIMCVDKNNQIDRLYQLPAMNGFTFNLRIKGHHSLEALHNFETILREQSCFFYRGEDISSRKMEASPDDKLMRQKKEHPIVDLLGGTFHLGVEKTKKVGMTIKEGSKQGSKKVRMNLKDIKNRNWDEVHSTFKNYFFENHEKMTKDIHVMRKHNFSNFKDNRSFEELRKADHLPIFYLPKEDIEEVILKNKDLAGMGKFQLGVTAPKVEEKRPGMRETIKQEIGKMKDNLTGRVNKAEVPMDQHKVSLESMTHYEG